MPAILKPFPLFDAIKDEFDLKNDAALCREMKLAPPQISKVRSGALACSDAIILRVHETFGLPVVQIRELLAQGEAANAEAH